jgi:prepilin-type N-terminal cleavage/methylation domain-containing protein
MKKGFTLIELIIVVIVIGILATLAVPQYLKAVERTKGAKARHALGLIGQAEKMYRAEHDAYISIAAAADLTTNLTPYVEMADIVADTDWAYTLVAAAGPPQTFVATATRSAGPNNTETITMTESGVWAGSFTP